MNFNIYLVYFPNQGSASWEVLTEPFVPDLGAFPEHFYRKYKVPSRLQHTAFRRAVEERNRMNDGGITPCRDKEVFPSLQDILKEI